MYTSGDQPPDELHVADHNPFSPAVQPVFSPAHLPLTYSVLHQFASDDIVADGVKNLAKLKTNNIHCTPLMHLTSHFVTKGYQVGQEWFCLPRPMLTIPNHLFFTCLQMASISIYSISSPRTEVYSSLLKKGALFAFFQSFLPVPDCHDLSKIIESGLSSALVVASHQIPWTCVCQTCLNVP